MRLISKGWEEDEDVKREDKERERRREGEEGTIYTLGESVCLSKGLHQSLTSVD